MSNPFCTFLRDTRGAVTVDWTVLSAAVVAMSLATVGVLNGGIQAMVSRADAELRDQQMSDNYIGFTSAHFEPLYENNITTAQVAEDYFNAANAMMNQDIINALETGITALEEGRLTHDDMAILMALASVAHQRNIIDDGVMNYYFGFDGSGGRISTAF